MPTVKAVAVGDVKVGKTCMLLSFVHNAMPGEAYTPTVYDHYVTTPSIDGYQMTLHLWDTGGKEDYDNVRPLCYEGADVILICFSTVSRNSFENVKIRWAPMIRHYRPEAAIILVGTQTDLRADAAALGRLKKKGHAPVSADDGQALAQLLGAKCYLECSALTQSGLKPVMTEAVKAGTAKKKENGLLSGSKCVIL